MIRRSFLEFAANNIASIKGGNEVAQAVEEE